MTNCIGPAGLTRWHNPPVRFAGKFALVIFGALFALTFTNGFAQDRATFTGNSSTATINNVGQIQAGQSVSVTVSATATITNTSSFTRYYIIETSFQVSGGPIVTSGARVEVPANTSAARVANNLASVEAGGAGDKTITTTTRVKTEINPTEIQDAGLILDVPLNVVANSPGGFNEN